MFHMLTEIKETFCTKRRHESPHINRESHYKAIEDVVFSGSGLSDWKVFFALPEHICGHSVSLLSSNPGLHQNLRSFRERLTLILDGCEVWSDFWDLVCSTFGRCVTGRQLWMPSVPAWRHAILSRTDTGSERPGWWAQDIKEEGIVCLIYWLYASFALIASFIGSKWPKNNQCMQLLPATNAHADALKSLRFNIFPRPADTLLV